MTGINSKGELVFVFEKVDDDNLLYDKVFNTDYQKGYSDLIIAVNEIKKIWFTFKDEYSYMPPQIDGRIRYIDKIYERVNELYNYTRELDAKYALGDEYVSKALTPLILVQSEVVQTLNNLNYQRDFLKELKTENESFHLVSVWQKDINLIDRVLTNLKDIKCIQAYDINKIISKDERPKLSKEHGSQERTCIYILFALQELQLIKGFIRFKPGRGEGKDEVQWKDFNYIFLKNDGTSFSNVSLNANNSKENFIQYNKDEAKKEKYQINPNYKDEYNIIYDAIKKAISE